MSTDIKKTRVLLLTAFFIMLFFAFDKSAFASENTDPAIIVSGSCGESGDNIIWSLDDQGNFNLSGEGKMMQYRSYTDTPWYQYRRDIVSVKIGEGIENIPADTFREFSKLESIEIPATVTDIGTYVIL